MEFFSSSFGRTKLVSGATYFLKEQELVGTAPVNLGQVQEGEGGNFFLFSSGRWKCFSFNFLRV